MSAGIALGVASTVVGLAGTAATIAAYMQGTNAQKGIAITVSNHTVHGMYGGQIKLHSGQGMDVLPSNIPSGKSLVYGATNRPGMTEGVKGVITYKTYTPGANNTNNPSCTICVFFENPYSSNNGTLLTRFNVQADYHVNEASNTSLVNWIDQGSKNAADRWEVYDTWAENSGGSHYWIEAYMTNANPAKLEIHIHGRGGNDIGQNAT
jgi:hypothetical protein